MTEDASSTGSTGTADDRLPPATDLSDRYGRSPSRWRPLRHLTVAVIVLASAWWVVWAMLEYSLPDVKGEVVTFEVIDEHSVEATLDIVLADGVEATCRLRSMAEDKNTVGDLSFTPHAGRNTVTVRTERRATSVDLINCTAND